MTIVTVAAEGGFYEFGEQRERTNGINMRSFARSEFDLTVAQPTNVQYDLTTMLNYDDLVFHSVTSPVFHFAYGDDGLIDYSITNISYKGTLSYSTSRIYGSFYEDEYIDVQLMSGGSFNTIEFRHSYYADGGVSFYSASTSWTASGFSIDVTTWLPLTEQQRFNLLFAGGDTITATKYADTIDGGAGADVMTGGLGDDIYYVDNTADVVVELAGGGNDTVYASASYQLGAASFVNTLASAKAAGFAGLALTGNDYDQTLRGDRGANALNGKGGNDLIDGLSGADQMIGGAGNDTMNVDNTGDVVVELAGGGAADKINTSVNYTLAAGCYVEILSVAAYGGTAPIALTGNTIAQRIIGNAGANALSGLEGNDTLTGNAGADRFVFAGALNGATNLDTITDFSVADDTIALRRAVFTQAGPGGTLAAAAFHTGASAHDASDRIVYNRVTGIISYDADGTGALAAVAFAKVTPGLALTAADFVIF